MKKLFGKGKNIGARLFAVLLAVIMLIPMLAACTEGQPITESKITEARLNKDGNKISVKAQFTEKTLSSLDKNAKLHLLEYTSDMDVASDPAEAEDVGETKAKETVSFEISLADGVHSRRYSSFAVAAYDEENDTYTILTPLAAISLDEGEEKDTDKKTEDYETSIKGLATDDVVAALKLGAAHALVEVRLEQLLLSEWQEDAVAYVHDGITYYMRGSELSRIDGLVKSYCQSNVNVYLQFILKDAGENLENSAGGLAFPGAEDSTSYLVNMDNPKTARRIEGAFDFLAYRYSESNTEYIGVCNRFVIGKNVNNTDKYANCGGLDNAHVMSTYEKLVRVANTALDTHNQNGYAYISIDSNWTAGGWKGEEFIAAFAAEAKARGDYDWQVSCGMYAPNSELWEETTTDYITPETFSALTDLMAMRKYKFNETDVRGILIHSLKIPGGSSEHQAASYAYAYYCALEAGAEALIYSTLRDREDDRGGIMSQDSEAVIGNKPLCEVFRLVDTDNAEDVVEFAEQCVGLRFNQVASALGDKAHPVVRVDGSAGIGGDTEDVPVLQSFGGEMGAFTPTANVRYAEFEYSETYGESYLNMSLDEGKSGGVYATVAGSELLNAEEMTVTLYAGNPSSASKKNSVTLNMIRPSKGNASDEKGAIIYTATVTGVSGSAWQNVSFDISDFCEQIDGGDGIIIYLTASTPDTDDGYFGVKDIYVEGVKDDAGVWGVILIIAVILIMLGIVGVLVYFVIKRRGGHGKE